jgi:type IV pilus assembly protein PilE
MIIFNKRRMRGVTLIELMVTLAILAIIVTIGYPLYTQQLLKGQRGDASAGLKLIALAQEREFAVWGQYSELAVAINTDGEADIVFDDNLPLADVNSNFSADLNNVAREFGDVYRFTVDATASTFLLTATPVGTQADDLDCASYTLDQTGLERAVDDGGTDQTDLCW